MSKENMPNIYMGYCSFSGTIYLFRLRDDGTAERQREMKRSEIPRECNQYLVATDVDLVAEINIDEIGKGIYIDDTLYTVAIEPREVVAHREGE